jgi:hypothetical protein
LRRKTDILKPDRPKCEADFPFWQLADTDLRSEDADFEVQIRPTLIMKQRSKFADFPSLRGVGREMAQVHHAYRSNQLRGDASCFSIARD